MQIEHNNRLYKANEGDLEITCKSGRHFSTPNYLYKFYALTELSINAITNHYIYAPKPYELNDRFDSSPLLVQSDSYDDEVELLKMIGSTNMPSLEEYCILNEFGLSGEIYEYIFEQMGVVSMTTNLKDILMWSHYAKNNGFCVEYSVEQLPFEWIGPFPIQYCKQRIPYYVKADQISIIPLILCFQKNSKWRYEKEWRFLIKLEKHLSRRCLYPVEAIAGIYFGASFFSENEYGLDLENELLTHVKIDANEECGARKIKLLDFIIKNGIPTHFDFTANIDEIEFDKSLCVGKNGNYKIYSEI